MPVSLQAAGALVDEPRAGIPLSQAGALTDEGTVASKAVPYEQAGSLSVPPSLQPEPMMTGTAPEETPAEAVRNAVDAFGTQALSTAALGYDDEIAGFMGDDFTATRDKYRAGREAINARSPTAGQIGRVAGVALTMALPASAALRAGQVAKSTLVGGVSALGHSEADLTQGQFGGAALDTGLGLATGLVGGKVAQDLGRVASTYTGRAGTPTVTALGREAGAPIPITRQAGTTAATALTKGDREAIHPLLNIVSSSSRSPPAGVVMKNYPVEPEVAFAGYLKDIERGAAASTAAQEAALNTLKRAYNHSEGDLGEAIAYAWKSGLPAPRIARAVGVGKGGIDVVPDDGAPSELADLLQRSLKPGAAAVPGAAPTPAGAIPITGPMLTPGYRSETPSIGKAVKKAFNTGPKGTVLSYVGAGPLVAAAKLPIAALQTLSAVGQKSLALVLRMAGEGKRTGPWVQQAIDNGVPERTVRGIIAYYAARPQGGASPEVENQE